MRVVVILALFAACGSGQTRRVTYQGAEFGDLKPIPKFDKGYLFYTQRSGELTVFHPTGRKLFTRTLEAPGGLPCWPNDTAIATDGSIAVSISFHGPLGFTGAILLLDATGKQTAVIQTGRYEPAHIGFDRHQALWSIGSKYDEVKSGMLDKNDYFLVRKFSKDGRELGAFIPRSLWGPGGDPGGTVHGYWHLAAARNRMAAIVHENFDKQVPELIEWDFDGKLLARTPISGINCGRAYTESGRLFGRTFDKETKTFGIYLLDTASKQWKPTGARDYIGEWGLLLGAEGDELVFRAPSGPGLIWRRP